MKTSFLKTSLAIAVALTAGVATASEFNLSQIYLQTFDTAASSADFTVRQQDAANNIITFGYDFSTFAQANGGNPTSIPESPSHPPAAAAKRALYMAANTGNTGAANGLTAFLNASLLGGTPPADMLVEVDMWINYNGGDGGGTGSTESIAVGLGDGGATSVTRHNASVSNFLGQPFKGVYGSFTGVGGANLDYVFVEGDGTTLANKSAVNPFFGNTIDGTSNLSTSWTSFFTQPTYETLGAPGKAWNRVEIAYRNGQVRLALTPTGSTTKTIVAEYYTPIPGAISNPMLPALGYFDSFNSLANPASDNFGLFDNLRVSAILPPTNAESTWYLYE
jgi:hypothetical protein